MPPLPRSSSSTDAIPSSTDLGWACVLILEALVSALVDPELGTKRLMVTRAVKEMADERKQGLEGREGVESAKPMDVYVFLQHLATFEVGMKEDKMFYRRLVMSFAWRREMPKLAISLGLEDQITDMIEELISKGRQLDAINFVYEAGLQDKFPPVPLLKSVLIKSKKASSSKLEVKMKKLQLFLHHPRCLIFCLKEIETPLMKKDAGR